LFCKEHETDAGKEIHLYDLLIQDPKPKRIDREEAFRHFVRGLTLEEQTILFLHYVKEATMKEIGQMLNLSESRVSQMHTRILGFLQRHRKPEEISA
jgi:RNA polymerase sigma factor for flagellar operon FliA